MATQKLTKTSVDKLAPGAEDYVIWDVALPGFGIRVKPSNVKSYVVQYRNRKTGASRRKTIGQHGPLLTFHKAKERARIILADALKGNDPVADDRAIREAATMRHLAADYLEQHAIPKKRPRSVENDRSMINRIILPRLGSKKVAAVQSATSISARIDEGHALSSQSRAGPVVEDALARGKMGVAER